MPPSRGSDDACSHLVIIMLRLSRIHLISTIFIAVLTISSLDNLLPVTRCSVLPSYLGCTLLVYSLPELPVVILSIVDELYTTRLCIT